MLAMILTLRTEGTSRSRRRPANPWYTTSPFCTRFKRAARTYATYRSVPRVRRSRIEGASSMAWTSWISGMLNCSEASRMISRETHSYPSSRASLSATSLPRLYEPLEIVMIGMERSSLERG